MSQQSNLVGQTLGQYQIVELVGEGGMAAIYKAWQPSLKRYVALKVLAPRLSNESEFLKRFHQEAVAAANLKHTHIVTVYDVGVEGDYHYMAMEFIEGTSLQERLRSGQAFTLDEVVDVVSQIGAALDYAHQRGFIHRDIKPANILIEPSGRAVLTDFGIVKALSESGVTSALTQAGTIVGTPQYMSPEQVKDEPLDHRSDLYSLGIVCFEMLSGQVPFDGTTTHAILYAQVNTPPPPLRKFSGLEVPAPVEAAMNKMLAKDRDSRYDSAGEFARDLTQAVAGVWPAGIGGETAVVGHMGSGTAVAGGAAGGVTVPATKQPAGPPTPPPTVRQPAGPPTPPPAAWQPVGPPTPPPTLAPARRRRSPLVLEVGIAAGIVLVLGAVAAALLLSRWLPLRDAQEALAAGDYARAVEGFNQVLERNPDHEQAIEGLLEAADNLSQAGQFDAAIAAYERVERVKPDEVRVLQGLGQAYEAKGEWEQAAGWYEKWTQVAPDDAEARLKLGWAYFGLEDFERAVAEFERVTALQPMWSDGWKGLGQSFYALEQYENALEPLKQWSRLAPGQAEVKSLLGWCYLHGDQVEEASKEFEEAIRSDPENVSAYEGLGRIYYRQQDYRNALSAFQKWAQLRPGLAKAHGMVGWAALLSGDNTLAMSSFQRALSIEEQASWHVGLGRVYVVAGDKTQALEEFEKSLAIDPENADVYERVGWIYLEQGQAEDAVSAFERGLKLAPQNIGMISGLGYAYRALGEHRQALNMFQGWSELEPGNATALAMVGWSYFALEEFPLAIQSFESAVAIEEKSSLLCGIGESYRRMENCSQAVVYFERALKLDPDFEEATEGLEACQR